MRAEQLIGQLQIMAGGSLVMSTEQLAHCLSMNSKVISRMRVEGRFPIPHKLVGSKIVYSLHSIAAYLLSDQTEVTSPPPPQQKVEPEKRRSASKKAVIPDLSRMMLMRAFMANFELQRRNLDDLIGFFRSKVSAEELDCTMPSAQGTRVPPVKV